MDYSSTSRLVQHLHGVVDPVDRGAEACDPQEDEQLHAEGGGHQSERGRGARDQRGTDAREASEQHLCAQSGEAVGHGVLGVAPTLEEDRHLYSEGPKIRCEKR